MVPVTFQIPLIIWSIFRQLLLIHSIFGWTSNTMWILWPSNWESNASLGHLPLICWLSVDHWLCFVTIARWTSCTLSILSGWIVGWSSRWFDCHQFPLVGWDTEPAIPLWVASLSLSIHHLPTSLYTSPTSLYTAASKYAHPPSCWVHRSGILQISKQPSCFSQIYAILH